MTTEQFLKLLNNTDPICFANNKTVISLEQAQTLNGSCELHFIPNTGGTKIKDITKYNAYYIDLDCGRDENGNYFDLDVVDKYKHRKMRELNKFYPHPSAVIATRNGLQVYWFIKDNPTEKQWRSVENYLIRCFNADPQVKSPANQMRMPCSLWLKNRNDPFYCEILKLNQFYYSYIDFSHKKSNKQPVKDKKQTIFTDYKSVFRYITKEVDLFSYMREHCGLSGDNPNNFCCVFHNDRHPSASVFRSDGGTWLYSCRSTNCEFKIGNIVQVVEWKYNLPRHKAIEKICSDLNITYTENEDLKNLIMDNIRAIKDDIKNSHSDLYSVAYRHLRTLIYLHYMALDTLQYAEATGFLFSVSTGYLAQQMLRHDRKTTTEDISWFTLLELVNKIDLTSPNIPPEYRNMIKRLQGNNPRHINVYSLPVYDLKHLRRSDDIAKQIKKKNIRKTDFTYDTVYNAFGQPTADKVFPQVKGKRTHEPDEFLISSIEYLLNEYGYFTLKTLRTYYQDRRIKFNESVFVHQLPLITERLDLVRIHSNNAIKEKYGITSRGYPNLFVKKGN